MSIFTFILIVVVIGVVMWLINTYIPMEANVKKFLNIGVIIILVLWLLYALLGSNLANINSIKLR